MMRCLIIVSIFLVINQSGLSQNSANTKAHSDYRFNMDYLKSYAPAALSVVKAPSRFDTKDWILTGSVLSGLALLYFNDQTVYQKFQSIASENNKGMAWTEVFGNGLVTLPALSALYIYGSINDAEHPRNAALTGFQAFVFGAEGAFLLKHLTHRSRPGPDVDPNEWYGPFQRFDADAFPSGNTMRAFVVATTLAGLYDDRPWLGAGFYALASLTAYGRLVSGEHWPSDVLAGAALGYFIGRGIVYFNKSKARGNMEIMPFSGRNGFGLLVKF